jgi:tripartite-type tricarboxylate transporter receptor subunit TctC
MNPGGGTDLVGRAFAEALKKELNQSFAVENVPGAGSAIGTTKLHGSKPDGYTLGVVGGFLVSTSLLGAAKFPATDLTHLARLSQETFVLSVSPTRRKTAEFLGQQGRGREDHAGDGGSGPSPSPPRH